MQDMSDQAKRNLQRQRECPPSGNCGGGSQNPWGPNNNRGGGSNNNSTVSGPMATVRWFVLCNTMGTRARTQNVGNIELGMPPTNNNYYKIMAGSFQNEPTARNWVTRNCPSWRCDWNANCVAAGTPAREQATQNCPPGMIFVDAVFGQGYCKYP